MGGYLLLYPKAKVDIFIFLIIFFRIVPDPSMAHAGRLVWATSCSTASAPNMSGGGVAYWAHAGGFVVGFMLNTAALA